MSAPIQDAVIVGRVIACIGFAVVVPLISLHVAGFVLHGVFANDKHHVKKTLFAALVAGLVVEVLSSVTIFFDWRGSEQHCYYASSVVTVLFIMTKQVCLLFLYQRAKLVHEALRLDSWKLVYFRWLAFLSITAGVTLFFYWAQFIWIHGKVNVATGVCILYTESPAEIIVFAVCDAVLSAVVLMLFFIPLSSHLRQMVTMNTGVNVQSSSTSQDVRRVANRNMVISAISILGSLACLCVMAGIMASTPIDDPSYDHLLLWAYLPPHAELILSLILLHTLTKAWLPNFRQSRSTAADGTTSQNKSGGRGKKSNKAVVALEQANESAS